MDSRTGSCLCGGVTYKLKSDIKNSINCHCNFCRSQSGAAYSSYAIVPENDFEIETGEKMVKCYEIEEGKKYFCSNCGTPIFSKNNKFTDTCMIYLGTLNGCNDITPRRNVWYENKLEWVDKLSSIKSINQGIGRRA